jgi:hypothetical protein
MIGASGSGWLLIIIQPHSLFSTIVYIYLQTDFTPLTTTLYPVPLLFHNRQWSSVLVGLRLQVLSYTHYTFLHFSPSKRAIVISKMFWLDGSSTLPSSIVSMRFLKKPCVENQAKIAKSWVEIGNFNHWCQAASQLVDLTYNLICMDNDLLYYEGLISYNERLCLCSKLSSQLVNLVSCSMFECACERLLGNFKFSIPPVTTSLNMHHNHLVNKHPLSASTEMGAEVTTTSPVLPCHMATSPQTTTTSTPTDCAQPSPTSKPFKVATAMATELQHSQTPLVQCTPVLAIALHKCENQSSDQLAQNVRVSQERERMGWEEGVEEKKEERRRGVR